MRKKLMLTVGVGIGYVLGSRAGRNQYNALIAWSRKTWNSPQTQRVIRAVTGAVKDHAPDVAGKAGAKAKKFSAEAANKARRHGRTGLADNLDKAGDFAHDTADYVGDAAANAAGQHGDHSGASADDDINGEASTSTQAPRHAAGT